MSDRISIASRLLEGSHRLHDSFEHHGLSSAATDALTSEMLDAALRAEVRFSRHMNLLTPIGLLTALCVVPTPSRRRACGLEMFLTSIFLFLGLVGMPMLELGVVEQGHDEAMCSSTPWLQEGLLGEAAEPLGSQDVSFAPWLASLLAYSLNCKSGWNTSPARALTTQ